MPTLLFRCLHLLSFVDPPFDEKKYWGRSGYFIILIDTSLELNKSSLWNLLFHFILVPIHICVDFIDTEMAALHLVLENSHAYGNYGAYAY